MQSDNDEGATETPKKQPVKETLWSATLMDMLILALKKNKSDNEVIEILKELKQKRYKTELIVDKITASVGEKEALRVRALIKQSQ